MRKTAYLILALFVGGCTSISSIPGGDGEDSLRNVILIVSDGAGPAYFTMTRDFDRAMGGDGVLAMDAHLSGSVRTWAANTKVTDSASSATAYASGVKSNNGHVGTDAGGRPVGTLLEAAEHDGWATGLVTTTRITHATPAAFYAHINDRSLESDIAPALIASGVDVVLGGGARHFLPVEQGGSRVDGRDLFGEAEEAGYSVVRDRSQFTQTSGSPVLALMASSHLDYEIDRNPDEQVSLRDMTERALEILEARDEPFFLVIEAGRIDHAGHGNDPASVLRDMQAFEQAFETIARFAESDGRTLVVSTSDHETGGMSLGRGVPGPTSYNYWPERLDAVSKSTERFRTEFQTLAERGASAADLRTWLDRQLAAHFDTESLDSERSDRMDALIRAALETPGYSTARAVADEVMDIVSDRALVGWYSTSHSGVDVPLFALGPGAEKFTGNMDNTEIALRIAEFMDVDLSDATSRLRRETQTN